jgi:hypothetical protein
MTLEHSKWDTAAKSKYKIKQGAVKAWEGTFLTDAVKVFGVISSKLQEVCTALCKGDPPARSLPPPTVKNKTSAQTPTLQHPQSDGKRPCRSKWSSLQLFIRETRRQSSDDTDSITL